MIDRDLLEITAMSAGAALVVGLLALGLLALLRRRSLTVQLIVVSASGIVAVVAGIASVTMAMYVSTHDLVVSLWVSGIAAVMALLVAGGLGAVLRRSTRRLRSAVEAVGDGVSVVLAGPGNAELAGLAAELNRTSMRLASAREEVARIDASRRELMAWIAHDLRTPLAGLRAMSEALEDGVASDPARYLQRMRGQVDRLTALVDDLFELSQIQAGVLRVAAAPVSLRSLAIASVAEVEPVALARGIRIETDVDDAEIVADARLLTRVVTNLLANAVEHSAQGALIELVARRRSDGTTQLTVQDSAGGIDVDDFERIFEPGWRGTASRTPSDPIGRASGAGLGLAIARGIVTAHSGRIEAANVGAGSRFDVHLPAAVS